MNRFSPRAFGALLFVFGSQAAADIPMVSNPILARPASVMPTLPAHAPQEFKGASTVSTHRDADASEVMNLNPQTDISAFGVPCEIDVHIQPEADAMIALNVFAPCKPHSAVHVSHGGLSYSAELSLTGRAALTIPAMHSDAEVFVAVDEDISEHHLEVPEVGHFARVALSSVEGVGPKLMATAMSKPMKVFQSSGLQVFSVDLRELDAAMTYRLTLRHEVTAQNCDRPVQAHLRRVLPNLNEQFQDLSLVAQDCNHIGKILELKNVVPDLKLAAR